MRLGLGVLGLLVTTLALVVGVAGASSTARVFYLALHARQCLIIPASDTGNSKTVLAVPCSNPAHNEEIYAVRHGGWGHTPPTSAKEDAIAKSLCLSSFQRLTGHAMSSPYGWLASWPDPGAETARYGDKVVCGLRDWPRIAPLGKGWHVH
jgi:hypothetical protein